MQPLEFRHQRPGLALGVVAAQVAVKWIGGQRVNVSGLVMVVTTVAGIAMEIVRKVGTIITTIVTTTIDTRSPFENGCVWGWTMIDAWHLDPGESWPDRRHREENEVLSDGPDRRGVVADRPESWFIAHRSVASGWSGRWVGLAPTGKRRLFTAHTQSGNSAHGSR